MKPIFQDKFGAPGGNCLQACVASVMELTIDEVPHFCDEAGERSHLINMAQWFAERGAALVFFKIAPDQPVTAIPGLCILGVVTDPPTSVDRPEWIHAVVGRCRVNWETGEAEFDVVHDPNPKPRKIVEVQDCTAIVYNTFDFIDQYGKDSLIAG